MDGWVALALALALAACNARVLDPDKSGSSSERSSGYRMALDPLRVVMSEAAVLLAEDSTDISQLPRGVGMSGYDL